VSSTDALDPVYAITSSGHTKRHGHQPAVDQVDLRIPAGVVAGFVGPNGAGKSTTTHAQLGLIRPTAGTAHVLVETISHPERDLSRTGAMIERPTFTPSLTGRRSLHALSVLGGHDVSRIEATLEPVGADGPGGGAIRDPGHERLCAGHHPYSAARAASANAPSGRTAAGPGCLHLNVRGGGVPHLCSGTGPCTEPGGRHRWLAQRRRLRSAGRWDRQAGSGLPRWAAMGTPLAVLFRSPASAIATGADYALPGESLLVGSWDDTAQWLPRRLMDALAAGGTSLVSCWHAATLLFVRREVTA
jgi:energy-coupling factor transporter ATP-binding protein EcfA2